MQRKSPVSSGYARQRGMTFISVCLVAVVVVSLGYVVFKSVPVASEYFSLKRALKQAAQESTVAQVKTAFDRVASIEYLDQYEDPIRGRDLQVTKVNDRVVVRVEYDREVPLFGPAFLVYKLTATSE